MNQKYNSKEQANYENNIAVILFVLFILYNLIF
jgi:hypothetical protein